jgi:cysteine desulfurase
MALKLPVYLDNAATTPVDPRVVDAMLPYLREHFGNPASSTHEYGTIARRAVEQARDQVAGLVGADPRDIVWTSGATESNNLAIKGVVRARGARGHVVSVQTEHKAVLDTLNALEREGYEVTLIAPQPDGLVSVEAFRNALRPDTVLASVMLVNNEIGVIQDVAALGTICKERGVPLHVDAAQATGKVAIDLKRMPIDLMSLTAHKTYGPKGIGALYVRRESRLRLQPEIHGGGHERGLRSGTLATHQIVGMGACYDLAHAEMGKEVPRLNALRDRLWAALKDLPEIRVNGSMIQRIANNLNITLVSPQCDALLDTLSEVALSSTSACSSGAGGQSHVLQALGAGAADGVAMRITVGRFNTEEEIDHAASYLRRSIIACRSGDTVGATG